MRDRIDEDPIPPKVWAEAVEACGSAAAVARQLDLHRNTVAAYRRGDRKCSGLRAKALRPQLRKIADDLDAPGSE